MSKSYDNTIPLFAGGQKALRQAVLRIVTDSRLPGEPKDPDDSAVFTLFRAFASEVEMAAFRQALLEGMAWGQAKQVLVDRIETDVAPMRERYEALIADPAGIDAILRRGAEKARLIATPKINELREALGLGSTHATRAPAKVAKGSRAGKGPRFASFRDGDGRFRFRLFDADVDELLLSNAFAEAKAAGALRQRLGALGAEAAVLQMQPTRMQLELDGECVAQTPEYADEAARDEALARLRRALDQLAAE